MASMDAVHSLLEQDDVGSVGSTFARGLPVVFELGENHFPQVMASNAM